MSLLEKDFIHNKITKDLDIPVRVSLLEKVSKLTPTAYGRNCSDLLWLISECNRIVTFWYDIKERVRCEYDVT